MTIRILDRATGAIIAAMAFALIAVFSGVIDAGPLDPPGAPAPTDSVRLPGTPISSLPFTAGTPGHYYVTRDLTATGAGVDGISVTAGHVTIDLAGFTLHGGAGTDDGIVVTGAGFNVSIRNGALEGWDGDGIDALGVSPGIISDITVKDVLGVGIAGGSQVIVQNCSVVDAGGTGIQVGGNSSVMNCIANSNGGDGIQTGGASQVRNSTTAQNSGDGIEVTFNAIVAGNISISDGLGAGDGAGIHITGSRSLIEHNNVIGADRGIDVDMGFNTIVRNQVSANTVEFDVVAGNALGPVVSAATIATSSNPHANYTP